MQSHNHPNLASSINPRAKRLSLRVDQKAGVIRLTIPKWTMQWQIDRFLKKNEQWIAERQNTLLPKIEIKHGFGIPFQGIEHEIVIEKHNKRTTEISLSTSLQGSSLQSIDYRNKSGNDDKRIIITTSRDDATSNMKRWMIDRARDVIEPLAQDKATRINKTISRIDLRDPTSRWGSCSTDARLMFSWRVIMAPPYVLDYLVAHEVAHLTHMNHSKAFWALCYKLADNPEEGRAWLKQNGNSLMRYF